MLCFVITLHVLVQLYDSFTVFLIIISLIRLFDGKFLSISLRNCLPMSVFTSLLKGGLKNITSVRFLFILLGFCVSLFSSLALCPLSRSAVSYPGFARIALIVGIGSKFCPIMLKRLNGLRMPLNNRLAIPAVKAILVTRHEPTRSIMCEFPNPSGNDATVQSQHI